MLSPVSADGPNQAGRQQDEQADRRKHDRQHSSKEGPRCGGPQKFLPCNPGSARKAGIRWCRRRWCSCGEVCPRNLLDPGRLFSLSGNSYLRRAACRAKGELPFNGMSATVAIALHTFHVTRAFLAWQTGKRESDALREVCKFFLSRTRCAQPSVRQAQKTPLRPVKIQKYFRRYIKTGIPGLYFNKHPKNLKHSAPQKKTCLPGEGKDREKDPHSRIGSCCLNGAWFHNCSGRWRQYPMPSQSSLFGQQVVTDPNESGKGLGLSCPYSWFNLSHR